MLKYVRIIILFIYRVWFGFQRRICTLFAFLTFAEFGNKSFVLPNILVRGHNNIYVGSHVSINDRVVLHAPGNAKIVIGNNVVLSFGSMLITGNRDLSKEGKHEWENIIIKDNVWIGAGAIILPGVTIGSGAVIAAGAVVTHDIISNMLVAGVPAEFMRNVS